MIQICNDSESLSESAAKLLVQEARHAVQAQGRFVVALAGGHTPERTYQLLARSPFRDQMPWTKMHVFWGDERCVPPDDPRSNARMARRALLDSVPIPAEQIHPILCDRNPQQGAEEYEALLQELLAGSPIAGVGFGIFLLIMRLIYGPGWAAEGVFTLFAVLFIY